MAIKLTPAQVADKQIRRLSGATQDMTTGIKAVTEAPGKKAAAKQQKLVQNWNAAVTSGRWANAVGKVSLEDWQNAILSKGVGRVAAGAEASRGKLEKFYEQLLPYQANLQNEVSKMPDLNTEDAINRAVAWMRGMSKFKKSG